MSGEEQTDKVFKSQRYVKYENKYYIINVVVYIFRIVKCLGFECYQYL